MEYPEKLFGMFQYLIGDDNVDRSILEG